MFSGIIETMGKIIHVAKEQGNLHLTVECPFSKQLKIDQSIAHNGVCLTVVKKNNNNYTVTAIKETLAKTNIGSIKIGDWINLERALKLGARIDGHLVQGHVDTTAICSGIKNEKGSWLFTFTHKKNKAHINVPKGSVCVNGVSLTVVDAKPTSFSVAIIPYTYEHTNFKSIKKGSVVNIEFDILGKYIAKQLAIRGQ